MARYKEYDYSQGKFIPINFDKQILPGTFETRWGQVYIVTLCHCHETRDTVRD